MCTSGQQRRVLEEDLTSRGAFVLQVGLRRCGSLASAARRSCDLLLWCSDCACIILIHVHLLLQPYEGAYKKTKGKRWTEEETRK